MIPFQKIANNCITYIGFSLFLARNVILGVIHFGKYDVFTERVRINQEASPF